MWTFPPLALVNVKSALSDQICSKGCGNVFQHLREKVFNQNDFFLKQKIAMWNNEKNKGRVANLHHCAKFKAEPTYIETEKIFPWSRRTTFYTAQL